jgi:SAM-dependent methyltransferase
MGKLVDELVRHVEAAHPRSIQGVREAMAAGGGTFAVAAERQLDWLVKAFGEDAIPRAVAAFVRFSVDVNLHQARYERRGSYESKSYADVYAQQYSHLDVMEDYLLGVYLTNVLWSHHMDITELFLRRFVARVPSGAALVEFAFGHGGWGIQALAEHPTATLRGFDISPAAKGLAETFARAAGVASRAVYAEGDALDPSHVAEASADAAICCFLVEHLEEPDRLAQSVARTLKPGGLAFLTGALTAAQCDHIYEYRNESELVAWAERAGLRVLETLSVNPERVLRKARFVPRSMALIAERPQPH